MLLRVWVWLGLCCALAGQTPPAREPAAASATIEIVPALRGDLTITISTEEMEGTPLESIRQASFPCNWRSSESEDEYLNGVCRRYLASDGLSAHGALALAPLAAALQAAGAKVVTIDLEDYGRGLAPPPGWIAEPHDGKIPSGNLKSVTYRTYPVADGQPEPFEIRIGKPRAAAPLYLPFGFTLFGPALLALWLRRRAERKGALQSASVWVHWILTGTWLYWISAVSVTGIGEFAVRLQIDSMALTFLIGAAAYAVPPLLAIASCIAILASAPDDSSSEVRSLVLHSVAREAVLIVPFGMFLVGSAMFEQDWQVSIASLPAAYVTYRVLNWLVGRWCFGKMEILARGDLLEMTNAIARRAGVALGGIYIIGNRSAREANAFAAGRKVVALTRGLVEYLSRRELLAVVGHEIGHLRRKHVGIKMMAFWGYILVVGPLVAHYSERAHLPEWLLSLPILPMLYILITTRLSRGHEFAADAQAVELAGDAEGMIASLARLSNMTRSPVDWGGIQGSILSHPSMKDRVLAIARRFNVAEERALALMDDPDLLTQGAPEHFVLPPECAGPEVLFTSSAKGSYSMWARWVQNLVLALMMLSACNFALVVRPRAPHIRLALLLCSVPFVGLTWLAFANWMERCFIRRFRTRLARRMGPDALGGTFAGLLPGARVAPFEGYYFWDAGFLWLSPDSLTYRGERTSFSLARSAVGAISVEKGALSWLRPHTVRIVCPGGAFQLSMPDRGVSRHQALRLAKRLEAWWRGEPGEPGVAVTAMPEPKREILSASLDYVRGWRAVRLHAGRALMLCVGLVILTPHQLLRVTLAVAFVPFLAPLAYLFAVAPTFFRRSPAPAPVAPEVPAPAEPAPVAEPA